MYTGFVSFSSCKTFGPRRQKMYFRYFAPSQDSDHSAHSLSFIGSFTGRILYDQGCKVFYVETKTLIRLRGSAV